MLIINHYYEQDKVDYTNKSNLIDFQYKAYY